MLIYTENIHHRTEYVFRHIANVIWNIPFEITSERNYFESYHTAKVSYTEKPICNEVHIPKKGSITNLQHTENWKTYDDIIQCFLLLSRYEEYLPFVADKHERFPFEASKQFKYLDIEIPFVDVFAFQLKERILKQFPNFFFPEAKCNKQLTVDIDRVYHHLGLGRKEAVRFLIRKFFSLQWRNFFNYFLVKFHYGVDDLQPTVRDDFDTYHYIVENNSEALFFIQVGNKSLYDNNYDYRNESFRRKVESLSWKQKIGLHPSYFSHTNESMIKEEKERLENMIGKPITQSRQHYIRLALPETYHKLLSIGIEEDYSMGFPDRIGYRAGTAYPFYWYNLKEESCTNLRVFPFQLMDVTLKNYMNLSVEEAVIQIKHFYNTTQTYGGILCIILHNQNLTNRKEWKGWRRLLDAFIQL